MSKQKYDNKPVQPAIEWLETEDNCTCIPNAILKHPDLSPEAKILWGVLWSYCNEDLYHENYGYRPPADYAAPGMQTLISVLNITEQAIRKGYHQLEAKGLLRVIHRGIGQTNLYELYVPKSEAGGTQC